MLRWHVAIVWAGLKITYRISNFAEPAKAFLGMMDRLLFIIILQEKQKHGIKQKTEKI